jgi:hypothetical protein
VKVKWAQARGIGQRVQAGRGLAGLHAGFDARAGGGDAGGVLAVRRRVRRLGR